MMLSIIIPVYNEEKTILKILDKIDRVRLPVKKEIIIIDDFSTDKTKKILKDIKEKNKKIFYHKKNLGKGCAVKTGLNHAKGNIVIIQDADLEYDPGDYEKIITPIINKKARVVYGSRVLKNGYKYSHYLYMLGGRLVTIITNLLFFSDLTDEPTCYKAFNIDVLKKIKINGKRFEWEPEVTAKILKKGIKIHEVPINYSPRSKNEGKKIKLSDGFHAIWTLFKYRIVD